MRILRKKQDSHQTRKNNDETNNNQLRIILINPSQLVRIEFMYTNVLEKTVKRIMNLQILSYLTENGMNVEKLQCSFYQNQVSSLK